MEKQVEQEKFIGGSIYLGLRKEGVYSNEYGIFLTSKRIIGVRPSARPYIFIVGATLVVLLLFSSLVYFTHIQSAVLGPLALLLVIVTIALGMRRWGEKDPKSIADLEARKNLEISRQNISRIELKKAGLLSGHLKIITLTADAVNFPIGTKFRDYDGLKAIMGEFCSIPPRIDFVEGV